MGFLKLKRELKDVKGRLDRIEAAFREQEEQLRRMNIRMDPETERSRMPVPAQKTPRQPKI